MIELRMPKQVFRKRMYTTDLTDSDQNVRKMKKKNNVKLSIKTLNLV